MTTCLHCSHTKGDHRLTVWDDSWGERHKFINVHTQDGTLLPMKAQTVTDQKRFLQQIDRYEWVFERKYDGMRAIVSMSDSDTKLTSRTGMSLNATFPELDNLHEGFFPKNFPMVLDGEIITVPESLEHLQERMGLTQPEDVNPMMEKFPVHIIFFDILQLNGQMVVDQPYSNRRSLLRQVLHGQDGSISTIINFDQLDQVFEQGWEGAVAKKIDSLYHVGKRRADWKKWKYSSTWDVVVMGDKPGKGQREGQVGSFEVGLWNPETQKLEYVGNVGAGLTIEERAKADQIYLSGATLILEVEYMDLVKTGLMREPRIIRIRQDKPAVDCTRDQ